MFKKLWKYLNPMAHLGEKKYPLKFPLFTTLTTYILLELFGYFISKHPDEMGNTIIFINFALILYFSFRSAIRGGLIVLILSLIYYVYFLYTRNAPLGTKETAAIIVALLSVTNLLIVLIVGWHRRSLDDLLGKEIQAKLVAEHEKRRWQTLMKQLPVGVIIAKAPTGEVIVRNEQAILLLGDVLEPTKSIKDYQTLNARINGKKLVAEDWPLAQALIKGKTISAEEIVLMNKGKKRTLFFNAAPIYDKPGKITAAVTTFHDITQQKELERQKDDFIGMASHELRTPLTSARIYAQILLKNTKKNEQSTLLLVQRVSDQLNRLSNLVTTMLDTTRLEQGKLALTKELFLLKDVISTVLTGVQGITAHKLTTDLQTDGYLYGNKERLSQVFTNLITNAIKFSPEESTIIVKSQKEKNSIIVSIQDFGVGLSIKEKKHIFDRFYQSKEHKTYPGLGLGLYLSYEIIKQFGGKMWVESEKGKGSTFYFSLPLHKTKNKEY